MFNGYQKTSSESDRVQSEALPGQPVGAYYKSLHARRATLIGFIYIT